MSGYDVPCARPATFLEKMNRETDRGRLNSVLFPSRALYQMQRGYEPIMIMKRIGQDGYH
ncbi:MAG: hypothetical protein AAF311_07580 [Pseudomonadota bacterium]